MALVVDFVMMVARCGYDVGILFSSDTDLVPATTFAEFAGRVAPQLRQTPQ